MTSEKVYRAFIVDDEPAVRHTVRHALRERPDIELSEFASGEECLKSLGTAPDMIILDYQLDPEGLNGMDTLLRIQATHPEIPVVFLSGQEKIGVAVEALKKGAVDYVVKNALCGVHVRNSLDKVLESRRLKNELSEVKKAHARDRKRLAAMGLAVAATLTAFIWMLSN
ncbi:MAG: response regulator [Bacteroidetes bacterium]|jgi:two-component system, NtrC family, response regulator AtoC|nr:MAG: response regulator [Bacteroidota bacterium]